MLSSLSLFILAIFLSVNIPLLWSVIVGVLLSGLVGYISFRFKKYLLLPFFISGMISGLLAVNIAESNKIDLPDGQGVYIEIEDTIRTFPKKLAYRENGFSVKSHNLTIVGDGLGTPNMLYPTARVVVRGRLYSRLYGDRKIYTLYVTKYDYPEDELDIAGLPDFPDDIATVRIIRGGVAALQYISQIRLWVNSRIDSIKSETTRSLMYSIIIGNRNFLDYNEREMFRLTGVGHLLALSGLHIGIISLALVLLFSLIVKKKTAFLLSSVAVIAYIIIAGMMPSLVRAGMIFVTYTLLRAAGRDTDFLNVLMFSALVMLLINPMLINDVGFLLSYGSTAGIYLLYLRLKDFFEFTGPISSAIAVSLSATIFTIPLLLYFFKGFSLLAVIGNLLVVPLFVAIVWLLFAEFMFTAIGIVFLNPIFDWLISLLWRASVWVSESISFVPYAYIKVNNFPSWMLSLWYVLLAVIVVVVPRLRYRRALEKVSPNYP